MIINNYEPKDTEATLYRMSAFSFPSMHETFTQFNRVLSHKKGLNKLQKKSNIFEFSNYYSIKIRNQNQIQSLIETPNICKPRNIQPCSTWVNDKFISESTEFTAEQA